MDSHYNEPGSSTLHTTNPAYRRQHRQHYTAGEKGWRWHAEAAQKVSIHLQLGLCLRLLQDRLHLGCLHHVALNLQLTAHEQSLRVRFAADQLSKVVIRKGQRNCAGPQSAFILGSTYAPMPSCGRSACRYIPVGLSPSPFPTSPLFFKSMCQLSVSPALFFSVNANTAFPCLMASFLSASDERALLMASKASDEGNAASYSHQSLSNRRSTRQWEQTYRS